MTQVGIVIGKKLGSNAHAAITTRGFAEMVRFGMALGGKVKDALDNRTTL